MSYKTITICLDSGATAINNIKLSLDLALQFEAHLEALYITYSWPFFYDPYGQMVPLLREWEEAEAKKKEMIKESFHSMVKMAGINFDWNEHHITDIKKIAEHGRTSDLLISSPHRPNDDFKAQWESFMGRLILQLGKPMLLLPTIHPLPETFSRVLIAWNGSREAARAVADALPLLQKQDSVMVLTIAEEDASQDLPNLHIGDYLARHDVKAEIIQEDSLLADPREWLTTRSAELRADLLVMGAYGHSRFSELILGGMTQRLLTTLPFPVLMSH